MKEIFIPKGKKVQKWFKNRATEREWITLVGDVIVEAEHANGAYTYKVGRQFYTVPASSATPI